MCLAIPAKVIEIGSDNLATVDILGATREISLDLTPSAQLGSYVLVHAGFAIEVVDEQFAQETIDLIREFPELAEEEVNGAHYAQLSEAQTNEAKGVIQTGDDQVGMSKGSDSQTHSTNLHEGCADSPSPSAGGNLSMQQMLSQIAEEM